MSITRDKLIPKISHTVNVKAAGHWYSNVRIIDVGEKFAFTIGTPAPTDYQLISLADIESVTWREETSHRIDGEPKPKVQETPKPKPVTPKVKVSGG